MPLTKNAPIDWANEIKHFKKDEFTCKCGCGLNNMHKEFVLMLNTARKIADIPFFINCGCRCDSHNIEVGGVKDSSHTKGFAVDIKCLDDVTRFKIIMALCQVGFKRILVYSTFIHVDDDLEKPYPILKLMK